jgi:hypothetical protein
MIKHQTALLSLLLSCPIAAAPLSDPVALPADGGRMEGVASAPDRTLLIERRFSPLSAQGAGTVVETYFALLEEGRYPEAYRLWADNGRASGFQRAEFARRMRPRRRDHVQVLAPGRVGGAAGTLYVQVPVTITPGRGRDLQTTRYRVTLRRSNRVPGASLETRAWRIYRIKPVPAGAR